MYVPEEFSFVDAKAQREFLRAHPFATLVASSAASPENLVASHLPLLASDGEPLILRGHLARKNHFLDALAAGAEVLAIFHGPHGYVSPSWYVKHPSVPTWNYAVVHAHAKPRLLDRAELLALLDDFARAFEGRPLALPDDYRDAAVDLLAGFALEVTRLEGKRKLSQNRTDEERARVADQLEARGDRALADLMRRKL